MFSPLLTPFITASHNSTQTSSQCRQNYIHVVHQIQKNVNHDNLITSKNGTNIEKVKEYKYLDIWIDEKLTIW